MHELAICLLCINSAAGILSSGNLLRNAGQPNGLNFAGDIAGPRLGIVSSSSHFDSSYQAQRCHGSLMGEHSVLAFPGGKHTVHSAELEN